MLLDCNRDVELRVCVWIHIGVENVHVLASATGKYRRRERGRSDGEGEDRRAPEGAARLRAQAKQVQ